MIKITTPKGDVSVDENDYVSLTDIENNDGHFVPETAVDNWLKRHHTLSYLRYWEIQKNENFNVEEMKKIEEDVANGSLELTLEYYLKKTAAIGITIKSDVQNSIFVHGDIAQDYCGWGSNHIITRVHVATQLYKLKQEELEKNKP